MLAGNPTWSSRGHRLAAHETDGFRQTADPTTGLRIAPGARDADLLIDLCMAGAGIATDYAIDDFGEHGATSQGHQSCCAEAFDRQRSARVTTTVLPS